MKRVTRILLGAFGMIGGCLTASVSIIVGDSSTALAALAVVVAGTVVLMDGLL